MVLGRLLPACFDRHVMADRAPGDGAENGVMMGDMSGDAADDGALQATCLGRRCRQRHCNSKPNR
jgi:hypothetical protein